jgi:hypothetical protein
MSIEQLAKRALQIQDACNPSGVALALSETIMELKRNGVVGTEDICNHPIVKLMAHKVAELCGMATWDLDRYWQAELACAELAKPECTTCQDHGSGACYSLGANAEHVCCNN